MRIHLGKGTSKYLADMICDVVAQLQSKCTAKSIRTVGLYETPDMRMAALQLPDHVDQLAEEAAGRGTRRRCREFALKHRFEIKAGWRSRWRLCSGPLRQRSHAMILSVWHICSRLRTWSRFMPTQRSLRSR
jgi:hypothetical protein